MAITVDSGNISLLGNQTNASSPQTWNHTTGANVDGIVVVVGIVDSSATDGIVSSVSFDGKALTSHFVEYDSTTNGHISVWSRLNSDVANITNGVVSVSFGGTVTDIEASAIGIESSLGSFAVDSVGTLATGNGSPSVSWTTSASNTIVFDSAVSDQPNPNFTANGSQVELYKDDFGQDHALASYLISSSTSVTMSWTDTDNDEDWVTNGVAFQELAASSDTQPAYMKGRDNISDTQYAYLGGQRWWQPAYMYGRNIYAYVEYVRVKGPKQGSNSQSAYLAGAILSTDNQPAYTEGYLPSASDTQPAYSKGRDTASDTQSAYLKGGAEASSSAYAYTEGAGLKSTQYAYLKGQDTSADNQPAYTVGGITSSSSKNAYLEGYSGSVSSQQNAYTSGGIVTTTSKLSFTQGQDTASDTQPAYLAGGTGISDSQPAYLDANVSSSSSLPGYTDGIAVLSSSQSGYTQGINTDSDSQSAFMDGNIATSSSQSAFCNSGELSTVSKQSAYLSADYKSSQYAYLEGESTVYEYAVVSTTDSSTSLKFRVLAENYAGTIYEAGRIVHRTIPGGLDITSGELRRKWSPRIKVFYTESEAGYGTMADLESLYQVSGPILWQDHFGVEHKVRITGDLEKSIVGIVIEGVGSAFIVSINLMEELT